MKKLFLKKNSMRFTLIIAAIFMFPLIAMFTELEFAFFVAEQGFYTQSPLKFDQTIVQFLFIITETVSYPYGVATGGVLLYLMSKMLGLTHKQTIGLFLSVIGCILLGLLIKTGIKLFTSEARPYLVWLSTLKEGEGFDLTRYYQLSSANKEAFLLRVINQPLSELWNIPDWLKAHWIKDKSYRFPSGHTFFAVFFAFFSAFLLPNKHSWFVFILTIWAILVMQSRLFLGMHVPIDLLGGAVIALIAALAACLLVKKSLL